MSQFATEIQAWVVLVPETCFKCGVAFGMPTEFKASRLRDRQTFYCPNGHGQVYTGKTAEQKRIEQLEADKTFLRQQADSARASRDAARRSAAALKGVVTRTKNRLAAGTCPCCDKHFKTLAKHMAAEHPEYATTDEAAPASS